MIFDTTTLKRLAYFLANTSMSELVEAGVITEGNNTQWSRFNRDFDVFIIKLSDDRRQKLCDFINDRLGLRAPARLEAAE